METRPTRWDQWLRTQQRRGPKWDATIAWGRAAWKVAGSYALWLLCAVVLLVGILLVGSIPD